MQNQLCDGAVYLDKLTTLQVVGLMTNLTPDVVSSKGSLSFYTLEDHFTFDNSFNFYKFMEIYKYTVADKKKHYEKEKYDFEICKQKAENP